jgi:hypothetical protein
VTERRTGKKINCSGWRLEVGGLRYMLWVRRVGGLLSNAFVHVESWTFYSTD